MSTTTRNQGPEPTEDESDYDESDYDESDYDESEREADAEDYADRAD